MAWHNHPRPGTYLRPGDLLTQPQAPLGLHLWLPAPTKLPPPPPLHDQVVSLLESIPKMFAGTQVQETCGGAALKSAVEALKGGEGGRLHAFLCTLPRRGALHLRLREVGRPPTDRDNLDSLLPEGKEFGALALDAAEHQVSVDLFLLAQSYVDAATLGTLCANTGGSLHHWCPWNPALDADELHNDLRWVLTRPQVWGRGAVAAGRGAWWALHAQTRGHVAAEYAQAGMVDPPPSPPLLRAWRRWVACACRAACWWSATWAPSTAAWTQTSTSPRCPATTAWRPSWRMRWAVRLAGTGRAGWGGRGAGGMQH